MTTAVHVLALVLGIAILVTTTGVVIRSMLMPRPARSRLTHLVSVGTNAIISPVANRHRSYAGRDHTLALIAPVSILLLLLVLVGAYLLGLALALYGAGDSGAGASLYQAGATLLTLGVVGPVNWAQTVIVLLAALIGLTMIAILIGYVLGLNAAYTERETTMAEVGQVAGEPAWGPELICRATMLGPEAGRFGMDVGALRQWVTTIRMTQTVNPLLNHMRSPVPQRNWVITMLALTDAAALDLCVVDRPVDVGSIRLLTEGVIAFDAIDAARRYRARRVLRVDVEAGGVRQAVAQIAAQDDMRSRVVDAIARDALRADAAVRENVPANGDPGIGRADFDEAIERLRKAGLPIRADLDRAWEQFSTVRAAYATQAASLADHLYVVRAPWSGARRPETPIVVPHLVTELA